MYDATRTTFYAAVQLLADGQLASVAMHRPSSTWFYAELADVDLSGLPDKERASVLSMLQRVPGTSFLTRDTLPAAIREWVLSTGSDAQTARTEKPEVAKVLQPLFEQAWAEAGDAAPPVRWTICRYNHSLRQQFYTKCNGFRRAGQPAQPLRIQHALVDALGLALCDLDRTSPMDLPPQCLQHLHMVLSTKGAASLRAWCHNVELTNPRVILSQRAAADPSQGAAGMALAA